MPSTLLYPVLNSQFSFSWFTSSVWQILPLSPHWKSLFHLASRTPHLPSFPPASLAALCQSLLLVTHLLPINTGGLSSWITLPFSFTPLVLFAGLVAVSACVKLSICTFISCFKPRLGHLPDYLTCHLERLRDSSTLILFKSKLLIVPPSLYDLNLPHFRW